jgi:hypothetical protein
MHQLNNISSPTYYNTPSMSAYLLIVMETENIWVRKVSANVIISVTNVVYVGHAIAEAVSRWLPNAAARVRTRVWQVELVVDKVAPGQVLSEYFGFPCQNR